MNSELRAKRRAKLRKKLRQEIVMAKTSERLQTLVKRLHVITDEDKREAAIQGLTFEQIDVTETLAKVKAIAIHNGGKDE